MFADLLINLNIRFVFVSFCVYVEKKKLITAMIIHIAYQSDRNGLQNLLDNKRKHRTKKATWSTIDYVLV